MREAQRIPAHPALLRQAHERSKRRENRVADQITQFAGSMRFVYIHAIWFGLWIGLGVDEKRLVIADHQWQTVQDEAQQNEMLLHLSNEILDLTQDIHAASTGTPTSRPAAG